MFSISQLNQKLIVSVQADQGEPFYPPELLAVLTASVLNGGADGLRLANADNIALIKKRFPSIPVIGITKPLKIPAHYKEIVYITPTFADVQALAEVGTEVVALDATLRPRPNQETLESIVEGSRKQFPQLKLMADISTLAEAQNAQALGFDLISTTLSGYTKETDAQATQGPDFELLSALTGLETPIVMEGRIWEPDQVGEAFKRGAYAVVIGSAITRPHLITQRFKNAISPNQPVTL